MISAVPVHSSTFGAHTPLGSGDVGGARGCAEPKKPARISARAHSGSRDHSSREWQSGRLVWTMRCNAATVISRLRTSATLWTSRRCAANFRTCNAYLVLSMVLILSSPQFRKRGKDMIDLICDYYSADLEDRPVRSQVEASAWRAAQPQAESNTCLT